MPGMPRRGVMVMLTTFPLRLGIMLRVATWVVAKGMRTSNAMDESFKPALVLRFFTVRWWLEVGADGDGKPLANLMINL